MLDRLDKTADHHSACIADHVDRENELEELAYHIMYFVALKLDKMPQAKNDFLDRPVLRRRRLAEIYVRFKADESTGTLPEGTDPYFCELGRLVYSCPQCGWYDDCPTSVPACPQCRCFDEGGLVLKGHCEGKGRPHKAADHRLTPTKIGRVLTSPTKHLRGNVAGRSPTHRQRNLWALKTFLI